MKRALAGLLYYSGILRLLKLVLLRKRAVVLMYHRVLTEEEKGASFSHPGIVVEKKVFEDQMRFLKKEFTIIGEDEFNSRLRKREPFESGTCMVTFDDGWRDNSANAMPALARHGIPALVFLTLGYIGSDKMFWQEQLTALLLAACRERGRDDGFLSRYGLAGISNGPGRLAAIKTFIESQKKRPLSEIEKTLDEIRASIDAQPGPGQDSFLDWAEVKNMLSGGVSFGSHGVTHRILTMLPVSEAEAELKDSRAGIALHTGRAPASFSYPNGNHDDRTAELVRKHGYAAAFTTRKGFVEHTDDPYRLNRVNIHTDATMTTPMFFCRILGIL